MRTAIGIFAIMAIAVVPVAAVAQHMNAEAFYQRAVKLRSKGALALFSGGEIKALMAEGKASGEAARAQRLAAIRNGTQPRYCPPSDVHGMNSNEFLDRLGRIPQVDRRRIDMTEATTRLLAGKYPCPRK